MSSNICTWRYKWNLKQSAGINSNGQKRNNIIKSNSNDWHSNSPISLQQLRYHSGVACFIGKRFFCLRPQKNRLCWIHVKFIIYILSNMTKDLFCLIRNQIYEIVWTVASSVPIKSLNVKSRSDTLSLSRIN